MLCSYTIIISGALASSIGFIFYCKLTVMKAPVLLSFDSFYALLNIAVKAVKPLASFPASVSTPVLAFPA